MNISNAKPILNSKLNKTTKIVRKIIEETLANVQR